MKYYLEKKTLLVSFIQLENNSILKIVSKRFDAIFLNAGKMTKFNSNSVYT